ncbi:hypothetical protein GGF50DRAFT_111545 [Schizophyllum commune]
MAASKRDRSNVSDSPSGDSESDSRLPSPPKRSKPARQDQRQRDRQSHGGHGSGSEDGRQDDPQPPAPRRSERPRPNGHGAQGKTKQDKSRKKVGTPDDNGTDGDVESEEETTKATSFDKFGSTAVHETVTRSVVRHVDFDAMLDPKPRTNVPKPVLMPRRVLLAKANSAGQRKDGPPRDTTSDHHHDEPQPDRPSPPEADSTPSASPGPQVAPLPVQPSSTPAVQHSSVPLVNPAPTALQYVPGFIPSSRHRFKAADYCGDSKSVILRASRQYEGYIIGRDAFPDAVKQRVWAQTAWEDACRVVGVTLVCDDNARKLIVNRGSRIRGEMIKTTRIKAAARFRFRTSKRQSVLSQNRKQHDSLVKDNSYLYQDEKTCAGYCHSRLILAVLEDTLFGSQETSFGVVYREYFDPLPVPTIALVYSMIFHAISEWSTGHFIHRKFTEGNIKRLVYEPHLRLVKDWDEDEPSTTRKMRGRWYKKIRASAGFDDVDAPVITVSEQARLKAREELSKHTGDTDTEEEGDEDADA